MKLASAHIRGYAPAPDLIAGVMTQMQVCADLGVSKSALQSWVRDFRLRQYDCTPDSNKNTTLR